MRHKNRIVSVVLSASMLLPNMNVAFARSGDTNNSGWSTAKKVLISAGVVGAGALAVTGIYFLGNHLKKEKEVPDGQKDADDLKKGVDSVGAVNITDSLEAVLISGVHDKYEMLYVLEACCSGILGLSTTCKITIENLTKRINSITPATYAREKSQCASEIINLVKNYLLGHLTAKITCMPTLEWLNRERANGNVAKYCQAKQAQEEHGRAKGGRNSVGEEEHGRAEVGINSVSKEEQQYLEEVRRRLEKQEKEEPEKQKMAVLKSEHDDYVAKFIECIRKGTVGYQEYKGSFCALSDRDLNQYLEWCQCINAKLNKDFCERLYAELSWVDHVVHKSEHDRPWMYEIFMRSYSSEARLGFKHALERFYMHDNPEGCKRFWACLTRLYSGDIAGARTDLEELSGSVNDQTIKILIQGVQELTIPALEADDQ